MTALPAPEGASAPSLSIVIPAYNEEAAIASIIIRTLAARDSIRAVAGVGAIEVIVVSDGSTDRTADIARGYADISLIAYARNRGYGAAIQAGFATARGELLGFLDADGTCDPAFFGPLCRQLLAAGDDVVLGARLGEDSAMPPVRRLGNTLYAGLLRLLGARGVTDSASGMRVLRRSSLPRLYPLPSGMHFTPAMSSVALFDARLRISEVAMPYADRTGDSKLHPLRDGVRFLRAIVDTALTYRPMRFFGTAGFLLLLLAVAYGTYPTLFYARHLRLEEWMFYRLSAVAVAVQVGAHLVTMGVLAQQSVALIHQDPTTGPPLYQRLVAVLRRNLLRWGMLSTAGGVLLNWRALYTYFTTRTVTVHWIYIVTGGMLVTLGLQCLSFAALARLLDTLAWRQRARERAPRTGT